ncbi:MAG: proteasome assembly chaperone 4 family protein, partial [Candidatus Bathyarchaeota archaeon]|nr:proteasome assembly chaperone 4 family protein [Candidatus Bathyarchaeota archaeon]
IRQKLNIEESIKEDGIEYKLKILDLENSTIAFFYDGKETLLGTLAFALPRGDTTKSITSSILLGGKNIIISRFLSEKIASKTNKMALVSVYTKLPEKKTIKIFSKIVDKYLNSKVKNRMV